MEGDKDTSDDKEEEEEEEEDKEIHLHLTAAASSSVDDQDLPIMHWEDLSRRIAELEKQEQERRERAKRRPGLRAEEQQEEEEEEEEEEDDFRRGRLAVVASRFHRHRKLQLCFINDEDSDDEDDKKVSMGKRCNGCHGSGLKQEVVTTLRTLRDEVLAELREKERLSNTSVVPERKHLERWELLEFSVQQLSSMRTSLQQEVEDLSSELVAQLLVRDQLRTKQDAMLLDVQDLT
ncbi:schwannomin-interacting protein 1 [Cynoglossus semilaevis]|uniref:schwannomin-interacting protein 1 n=1 Tax=Cynoglossus semilaevis TaxID=244447 RepID=UPI0004972944|nr:schwannomin-interacting protein 1-like [Cynoglossus semilaevis]